MGWVRFSEKHPGATTNGTSFTNEIELGYANELSYAPTFTKTETLTVVGAPSFSASSTTEYPYSYLNATSYATVINKLLALETYGYPYLKCPNGNFFIFDTITEGYDSRYDIKYWSAARLLYSIEYVVSGSATYQANIVNNERVFYTASTMSTVPMTKYYFGGFATTNGNLNSAGAFILDGSQCIRCDSGATLYVNTDDNILMGVNVLTVVSAQIFSGGNYYLNGHYWIHVSASQHGSGSASVSSATAGDTITVTLTPDSGYAVDVTNTTITSVVAIAPTWDSETQFHFIMPSGNVTISPAFVQGLTAGVQVSGGHGTATISNAHPTQGDTVTITCYPDSGYEVDTVTSFDATITKVSTNTYQFTMPNADVLATVTFKESTLFNITVETATGGTVSVVPTQGYAGTTINLTISPSSGYSFKRLYVLAGLDSVPTTKIDDTHYTFVLPSFNVVVRAQFWDGDPYSPGGNSTPSTPGGTGTFDDTTIPITPPAIPSVSVSDTGLYTIFSLTQAELNGFTNYLWSDLFSLPTVTKYLNNATDNILSLHILPFTVSSGNNREIKFMGIGTGTNGSVVQNQFQKIQCGSILLEEYYGSALDYNPWTKITLYVPYCGEIALDPDEVMGKTVGLTYTVDILTGDCYANVDVDGTTMYQLSGNCAMRLPVSAANWSRVITATRSALMLAAGVGSAALGAVGAGVSAIGAAGVGDALRQGDIARADSDLGILRAGQSIQQSTPQVGTANSYMATMSQKSTFIHTGVQTGGAGFMSVQVPYVLIKRPRQSLPENFNKYQGYPAHYTRTLSHMSGYTTIIDWNPDSIPCTEEERKEIDMLLKTGVIL